MSDTPENPLRSLIIGWALGIAVAIFLIAINYFR